MLCEIRKISKQVRDLLRTGEFNHLRRHFWRGQENPWAGHCYIACEVVYHLAGGRESGLVAHYISNEDGSTHWYLVMRRLHVYNPTDSYGKSYWLNGADEIIDPTVEQFDSTPNYSIGVGCGFCDKKMTRRAQKLAEALDSFVEIS